MFQRWILTLSSFILEILIARTIEASLPTAVTFSSDSRFKSADAVRDSDEDDDYSLVVTRGNEILTSTQTHTGHYREITLTLTAFKETFVLDLKLNTYLLSSTYIEKEITNGEEIYNDVNHVTGHCYYTGRVRNRSQSTAAVSTCKGITGYFAIGNVSYHIEPKGQDLYGRHRVFRDRDDVKSIFRCGTDRRLRWMSSANSTSSFGRSIHRMKRSFLYPQDADKVDKVVEVYVANDRSQYLARSSDVNSVYRRTKDIVNVASLAYQPLGIYLVLVGVEVWTDSDRFTIRDTNVSGALAGWYTYRQNSITPLHYNDNAVLLNNVAFYGGIVGKAIVGSMCSNQYSGSIVSDLSSNAAVAGSTLAHEMGHNFGLQHDNDQCNCDDSFSYNRCIMYPSSNSNRPSTKWSSCSKTQFTASFGEGRDICLYNIPPTIFQPSSTCGNGIVEDGEQCDCGKAPSSECSSTCCNSTTCQLTASAACASGRCCDISRCQVKSSGTECRSRSNDCDLSESCNGVDARCPTDSYKPDGTDCTNIESAYCYQGQCRSHKSQCDLLWGPGTLVSDNLCYTRFNGAGAHYGNCGIRWTSTTVNYISCDSNDVMCGKLQCQDTSKALFYYQDYYLLSQASIGSYSCHSVIFDFGIGTQDPGLVPNGAKCGDRQMCVNQKCIPVTISPATIPTTTTSTTTTTTSTTTTTTRKPTTTTSTSTSSSTTTRPIIRPTSASPTSKSSSSSSSATTKSTLSSLPSKPSEWSVPTTNSTFVTTEESNSTSPDVHVPGRLTGEQIGLIVGLTVGLSLGLLVLILLIVLGCRYRSNMRNFFDRKLRLKSRPKPGAGVDPTAATEQNNVFENQGYTSHEKATCSYDIVAAASHAPRPMAITPMRHAPAPPLSAFSITVPHIQQPMRNSVYSNFSEISTDQPWFSETEDEEPTPITIYGNQSEVINPNTVSPMHLPTVALGVSPQTPPKPQIVDHAAAKADTNLQVVRSNKPPQLPVKPPVVAQSKGCTLLPPTKQQNLNPQAFSKQPVLPTSPFKPQSKISSGKITAAMQPPMQQNIPPKPFAQLKPPTKPTTATIGANQTGGRGAVESSEEQLSVRQLMNQFGGNSGKPVVSPTRPIAAQRKPPQFSKA